MATGNPKPNYYTGTELGADVLQSQNGIWHGGNVSPKVKLLHSAFIGSFSASVTPATFMACDYLIFYSLIDMDSTDEQPLTNAITLPRYQSGDGVQMFLVATNPYVGGQTFTVNYTDSQGLIQNTRPCLTNTATSIGTILNAGVTGSNAGGAFIPLAQGSYGVRQANSITFQGPNGGLACLVLVKPYQTINTRDVTLYSEIDFIVEKRSPSIIKDGAYLNFLFQPNGSAAGVPIVGGVNTIWS